MLKEYQKKVAGDLESFFTDLDTARAKYEASPELKSVLGSYVDIAFSGRQFPDSSKTGAGKAYPRVCIKMPTGGGKTLIAIETIRAYQNLLAKKKTGLVVWITHREQIYRQTIENLQNKSHAYRQLLDQASGNRTLIVEKGQALRKQDVDENLVVLMLMMQSANRDTNKMFEDSGYTDFFPPEGSYELHRKLVELIPNLDRVEDPLFERLQVKTSLGNTIRTQEPLIIVDEFHTMFTDIAKATLDGLNPSVIIGLSATPRRGMNIVSSVSGRELKAEEMIKLDMHLIAPSRSGDWHTMLGAVKCKRDELEKKARKLKQNGGVYIRPIALIQVERTGRDQRGPGHVHSEDVREFLIAAGVPPHEIAVKSSTLDEIRGQKLLSPESEVRYIITKEALKEGWDCSFAYILGVIPNARTNSSMTQLVGRVLRQPYAKKTGVKDLDESYVYFTSGQTEEVLKNVQGGFEDEGLGDVTPGIEVRDHSGNALNAPKTVSIKHDVRRKYPSSLFLPVWLVKTGPKRYRKFSYDIDVKPQLSWDIGRALDGWLDALKPSITSYKEPAIEYLVNLDSSTVQQTESQTAIRFDEHYLTRRFSDTIDNPFIAWEVGARVAKKLAAEFDAALLDQNAGYIGREIEKKLVEHRRSQEKAIFEELIKSGALELVVSDDEATGFEMPMKDTVANTIPSSYRLNLYEDIETSSLNSLEQEVANIIDASPNVIWWARNKAQKGWYAVQGWQRGKIRPDFVIARKNDKDELEFVYVVENKGEQLIGNPDTAYKQAVFDRINALTGRIQQVRIKTTTVKLNDRFEFELIRRSSVNTPKNERRPSVPFSASTTRTQNTTSSGRTWSSLRSVPATSTSTRDVRSKTSSSSCAFSSRRCSSARLKWSQHTARRTACSKNSRPTGISL